MERMMLQDLLKRYGIHRPSELARAAQIHRQQAHMYWHGLRRIGGKVALRINDRTGIPVDALLRATPDPQPAPRGRPRKPRPEAAEP